MHKISGWPADQVMMGLAFFSPSRYLSCFTSAQRFSRRLLGYGSLMSRPHPTDHTHCIECGLGTRLKPWVNTSNKPTVYALQYLTGKAGKDIDIRRIKMT